MLQSRMGRTGACASRCRVCAGHLAQTHSSGWRLWSWGLPHTPSLCRTESQGDIHSLAPCCRSHCSSPSHSSLLPGSGSFSLRHPSPAQALPTLRWPGPVIPLFHTYTSVISPVCQETSLESPCFLAQKPLTSGFKRKHTE